MTTLRARIEQKVADLRDERRMVMHSFRVIARSQISRMAAALAYRTVFGLIPVLAIGLAVLGGFASDEQVTETVTRVLELTGLDEIVVDPQGDELVADTARLDEWLQNLVNKVRGIQFVAIGLTGLLLLAYAAISFMVEIERAVNHIYRAPTGRSWVRRLTQYWTTLTLGTIFLVGTFYVGERLSGAITSLTRSDTTAAQVEPDSGASESIDSSSDGVESRVPAAGQREPSNSASEDAVSFGARAAGMLVSLLIDFVLLFFVYMTVPNARVKMRCAAIGAGLAAIAWELGKWGFTFVVTNSSAQTLYGAIALIPLFLLWVYITWIIVLSGLQISYVLQHFRTFAVADDAQRGAELVEPLTLVRIALLVAERFTSGKTIGLAEVAGGVGLDSKTTLSLLERMTDASLLHRVPEGDEHEGFALARPAEQIRVREVLELGSQITGPDEPDTEPESIRSLRRAQLDASGNSSLASLLPDPDEGASLSQPE